MKFQLGFFLLGMALAELPSLQIADEDGIKLPASGDAKARTCPHDFPRLCVAGWFCCHTSKCCSKSCCTESARFCYDGKCYK